jgi:hypothetical protein
MPKSSIQQYRTGTQETKKVKVEFSILLLREVRENAKISWTQVETGSAVT